MWRAFLWNKEEGRLALPAYQPREARLTLPAYQPREAPAFRL